MQARTWAYHLFRMLIPAYILIAWLNRINRFGILMYCSKEVYISVQVKAKSTRHKPS
ncbi:hypothetical protein BDV25DRAFT_161104 [Aspergillus avenaceus]|uniref:Uncharacterized protein n=1 Tax=Aspergillus avenaceus TaxID=36643 RepID=A0A5N6TL71_ASPAV|nr:hypothetical protein BDV25DRAFT_161104 [Aspergillus avenaceus]